MYFIKELLAHRPIIMMAKTGTLLRYIAIADPNLIECVPTSRASMRGEDSPYAFTPSHRAFSTVLILICSILPLFYTADTGVASELPG